MERHPAPGVTLNHDLPSLQTEPPPTDDDRVLVPRLSAIVLVGADGDLASVTADANAVSFSALSPPNAERLQQRLTPFIGQPLSPRQIGLVRNLVVQHYRIHYRPFVAVLNPSQDITDGILRLRVIPFRIGKKTVAGSVARFNERTARHIRITPGEDIDAATLSEDLAWLNRSPFRQVSVGLAPGARIGDTDMAVEIRQDRPWKVFAGASNSGTRSTGLNRTDMGFEIGDLVRRGSLISYQLTGSDDAMHKGDNLIPLGNGRYISHSLMFSYPIAPRQDISLTAAQINTNTRTEVFEVHQGTTEIDLNHRSALGDWLIGGSGELSIGFEFRRQNRRINFDLYEVGRATADLYQLHFGWDVTREALGIRHQLSIDAHASPGAVNERNADRALTDYAVTSHVVGRYGYVSFRYVADPKPVGGWRRRTEISGQISSNALPSLSQMPIGGEAAVRGYSLEDRGFDHAFVMRNTLWPPARTITLPRLGSIRAQPLFYADNAYARNRNEARSVSLMSAGTGLSLAGPYGAVLQVRLDTPLKNGPYTRAYRPKLAAQLSLAF